MKIVSPMATRGRTWAFSCDSDKYYNESDSKNGDDYYMRSDWEKEHVLFCHLRICFLCQLIASLRHMHLRSSSSFMQAGIQISLMMMMTAGAILRMG